MSLAKVGKHGDSEVVDEIKELLRPSHAEANISLRQKILNIT